MKNGTKRIAARVGFLGIVAVSLVACRGIVGIEDLALVAGGGDGGAAEASADGAMGDGSTDAAPDADAVQLAQCLSAATECRKCCKDNFADFRDLQNNEDARNCFCDTPGECKNDCLSDPYCTADGQPTQGSNCLRCIDDKFEAKRCVGKCTSANCQAGLNCLRACDGL